MTSWDKLLNRTCVSTIAKKNWPSGCIHVFIKKNPIFKNIDRFKYFGLEKR